MKTTRIMIYVQHLLGTGHYKRAELLARALHCADVEAHLVSGGMPVPGPVAEGVHRHQLAPLRASDLTFRSLVDAEGRTLDDALKAARRDRLLALFADLEPQALIVETFPFGRWMMRFELDPLLDAAAARRPRPLILSSIRDVLQERSAARNADTVDRMLNQFDGVLVHGDPALIPLEASFPDAGRIKDKVFYTGYMTACRHRAAPESRREVIVSAGGGAVGAALFEAAFAARPLSTARHEIWRFLAGANMTAAEVEAARARGGDGIVVEPARPDFGALVAGARLSVSQAGYNTVMDILATATPAVLVPFAGHGETEQPTRARILAERGRVHVVGEHELSAESLAAAIDRALTATPCADMAVDMNGMAASADLVKRWLAE